MPIALVAHPSPDLYGSDRQLLESVGALAGSDYEVVTVLPCAGPLVDMLRQRGSRVQLMRFPVLRRSLLSVTRIALLLFAMPLILFRIVRQVRRVRPDVVYVNTVTIPWWVIAARLCRRPVVVLVHEAEVNAPRVVRWALAAPLLLASRVLVNSVASRHALLTSVPSLAARTTVLYNGIPDEGPADGPGVPGRLVLVGRLSPRKGTDVALEAVALLRADGRDVQLDVCGTAYAGYEWFEEQLRVRATRPDLAGAVRFLGYVNPTGPVIAEASVVLVPSRVEPFGNTAVEGLLAHRPVVASEVQGLAEIIEDGSTGLLVPPGDVEALATAIAKVLDDPDLARRLADAGRADAVRRFSVQSYRRALLQEILALH
jgi:glycosyltransferase involved in cell wall biosynthesis